MQFAVLPVGEGAVRPWAAPADTFEETGQKVNASDVVGSSRRG